MNDFRKEKKGREALQNDERLYYKFIVKYIEGLHGDLFTKVQDLYKDTKQKNPNVRDLTKTVQFMTVVTPNKPIPRHYKYRRPKVINPMPQQPKVNNPIPQMVNNTMPQMALHIPLLKLRPSDVTSQPSPAVPVSQPSPPVSVSQPSPLLLSPDVYQDLLNELQHDPELRQIINDFPDTPVPVSQPSPPVPVSQPSPPVSVSQPSPLLLSPDVYQDLLNELQQDPELRQIINDFPDDDESMNDFPDDDKSMNDFVWNDINMPDDISPLENEIEGY